jgi:hypothetical protein
VILLNSSALYLGLCCVLIVLLHVFHTKERRREVSALFLWEGLREDPRSRAARFRFLTDVLLFLQVASLLALALALAQPGLRTRTSALSGLAILVDGSASMRTLIEDGTSRYDSAIQQIRDLLERHPSAAPTLIQLSARPVVLATDTTRSAAERALGRSSATWYGDGSPDDLMAILGSVGGPSAFERIVLFTDHTVSSPPPFLDTVTVSGGANRAITAFTVRENLNGLGVSAFIEVANHTEAHRDERVRISDGTTHVSLSVFLPPWETEQFVVPFPNSTGTAFTASLEPGDDFPGDDIRYFGLERPIDLRVHWSGSSNRYLLAALEATLPVTLVESWEPTDLTIVYGETLTAPPGGNVLLIHADMPGYVQMGEARAGGVVVALQPDHPLLAGVDANDLHVSSVPEIEFLSAGAEILLAAEEAPLLVEFEEEGRRIVFFSSDLMATNLPITVDFPILVRNLVARLVHVPASLPHEWTLVGEPFPLTNMGEVREIVSPDGRAASLLEGQAVFRPETPGHYAVITDRGTYSVGANIALSESVFRDATGPAVTSLSLLGSGEATSLFQTWPLLVGLAILLLSSEALAYSRTASPTRRER